MVKGYQRSAVQTAVRGLGVYAKMRKTWQERDAFLRGSPAQRSADLSKRLQLGLNNLDAPWARNLSYKVKQKRYENRRWAPFLPGGASVLRWAERQPPNSGAMVSEIVRSRLLGVTSARLEGTGWQRPAPSAMALPYAHCGRDNKAYPAKFRQRLAEWKAFDKAMANVTFTKRAPLTLGFLHGYFKYASWSWVLHYCIHDFAALCGRKCVKVDDRAMRSAKLKGKGVTVRNALMDVDDIEETRAEFNKSGQRREAFGTLQLFDACHALCELRQLFSQPEWPTRIDEAAGFAPNEKKTLCDEIASWLVRNWDA